MDQLFKKSNRYIYSNFIPKILELFLQAKYANVSENTKFYINENNFWQKKCAAKNTSLLKIVDLSLKNKSLNVLQLPPPQSPVLWYSKSRTFWGCERQNGVILWLEIFNITFLITRVLGHCMTKNLQKVFIPRITADSHDNGIFYPFYVFHR